MASLDRISRRGNPPAPPQGASSGHWPAVPHLSPHGGQSPGANSKIFFPAHKCRVLETLLRSCPAPVPLRAKDREPPGVSRKRPAVRIAAREIGRASCRQRGV